MGYVVGRIVISFVLLPHYFRGDLYTAYELIERRFGPRTALADRRTISADSCGGRGSARLCGVDCRLDRAGDGRSRIDRDHHRIDADLHIRRRPGGGDLDRRGADRNLRRRNAGRAGHDLVHLVPGGWTAIHAAAAEAGKFQVFDFSTNFWTPYTFWAGLIGGTFLTTASHGTDQLIVQRLLAARGQKAIGHGAALQRRSRSCFSSHCS